MQQMGMRREDLLARPVVAIINTWSDFSPCHAHLRERAEAVKRGVLLAGGLPFELPALSLGEVMVKPTTMLYRNLLAMEVEELLRSHPVDGAVLLAGCDKTTPGTVMGATSMGLPFIFCPAGPDAQRPPREGRPDTPHRRRHAHAHVLGRAPGGPRRGRRVGGAGVPHDAFAGHLQHHGNGQHHDGAGRGAGPGAARQQRDPGDGRRTHAHGHGVRRAHRRHDLRGPDPAAAHARRLRQRRPVHMALGGSTNAVIHLLAMARRAGVSYSLDDLDAIGRQVPVLANLFPSGDRLMEDFHYAGGLPALMSRLQHQLRSTS
jgi:hypothetical protein